MAGYESTAGSSIYHRSCLGRHSRRAQRLSRCVLTSLHWLLSIKLSLTCAHSQWALIDLSMNPEKQEKLRAELAPFAAAHPTYEDFVNGLPYLDAVVREVIRLHPPLIETTRVVSLRPYSQHATIVMRRLQALEDDVIPLSRPVKTASGAIVNHLIVAKDTAVTIPMYYVNRAASIWGKNCKEFNPERWLVEDGLPQSAKEYSGYNHTLTFLDGPRTCLGKGFALIEIKVFSSFLFKLIFRFMTSDDVLFIFNRPSSPCW